MRVFIIIIFFILISLPSLAKSKVIKLKFINISSESSFIAGVENILEKRGYKVIPQGQEIDQINKEQVEQFKDDSFSDKSKVELGNALASGFILNIELKSPKYTLSRVGSGHQEYIVFKMFDLEKKILIKSNSFDYKKLKNKGAKEIAEYMTNKFLSTYYNLELSFRLEDKTSLSEKGISIFLDNKKIVNLVNNITKGEHEIIIEKLGYKTIKNKINLKEDTSLQFSLKLTKDEKIKRGIIKNKDFTSLQWGLIPPLTEFSWGFYHFNDSYNYYLSFKPIFDRFSLIFLSENTVDKTYSVHEIFITSDLILIQIDNNLNPFLSASVFYNFKNGWIKNNKSYFDYGINLGLRGGFGSNILYSAVSNLYIELRYFRDKESFFRLKAGIETSFGKISTNTFKSLGIVISGVWGSIRLGK